jgi:diguanylate cyclase (GGDEF)-like protein/PAS domain S-box-containing protein
MIVLHKSHRAEVRSAVRWVAPLLVLLGSVIFWPSPDVTRGWASYAPLHVVLEVFAVAVAIMVFGIAWATRRLKPNPRVLLLGVGFLGVALLDLSHALSFQGMPDFVTPSGAEKAINFWLAARTAAALALLVAALMPQSAENLASIHHAWIALAATLTLVFLVHGVVIFFPYLLPRTYLADSGLTDFKVGYEYVLIGAYLLAAWRFADYLRQERTFNASGLMAATATMAMSEVFFTLYANLADVYNIMGHVYKIAAYGFLYRALFVEAVTAPYLSLQSTEAKLAATLDALPDLLFEVDRDGNYLEVYASELSKLAAPQASLVGRNIRDVMPEQAAMQCMTALEHARNQGHSHGTRIFLEVAEGQRFFELSISRSTSTSAREQEEVDPKESFLVLSRDVTEIVNQERILEYEARLNAALLEVESHVATEDEPALLRHGVELAQKLTGSQVAHIYFVAEDQLSLQLTAWSTTTMMGYCTSSADKSFTLNQAGSWAEALRHRVPMMINGVAQDADETDLPQGKTHLSRVISAPVIDVGKVRMLLGAGNKSQDYTSQELEGLQILSNALWNKVLRHRQQASIRRLSAAMEQNPYSVIITDPQGNIEYVNPAFTKISGYSPEEVLGRNPSMFKSEHTPSQAYKDLWDHMTRGLPWRGELINRRKDGSVYTEQSLIYPIRDASGRIVNFLAHKEDVTQRKANEARIHQLAHFDQLTGLPNRLSIEDRLRQEIALASVDRPLTIMWLDLDGFKTINDSMGYETGDLLLVEIAHRLRKELDDKDYLARTAGDTFIAVLPETGHQTATVQAKRMLDALQRPLRINSHELSVTASIGLAVCPNDGSTLVTLLNRAETAMYNVKEDGRNGLHFYAPEMQENSERTLAVLQALKQALAREQLHIVYQPQMETSSGRMVGAEALLRWRHPQLGNVSPAEFIPLAERNGLIVSIGTWVLRQVMRQIRIWRDAGLPDLTVAVNLSAVQFAQPDLIEVIQRVAHEEDIDAGLLELELTEAVALRNPEVAAKSIKALQEAGFKVSIDDFGTGYSSMSYLKKFAVDKLKIDQSFVRGVERSTNDQAIVGAIVQMAHGLGTTAIAEGVETQAEVDFLRACGCDEIQGYWFSRPLEVKDLEAFVRRQSVAGDNLSVVN